MIILSWKGFYIFEVQTYNLLYHQSLTESNNLLYVVLGANLSPFSYFANQIKYFSTLFGNKNLKVTLSVWYQYRYQISIKCLVNPFVVVLIFIKDGLYFLQCFAFCLGQKEVNEKET